MAANQNGEYIHHTMQDWIIELKKTVKDPKDLEKLVWKTENGFDLNALYQSENSPKVTLQTLTPETRQIIHADKIMAANQAAQAAVKSGVGSLFFKASGVGTENEINALLKNIDLNKVPVHFDFGESNVAWLYLYIDYLQNNQFDPSVNKGSINYDPMSEILLGGSFTYDEKEAEKIFASVLQTVQFEMPEYRIINVNAHHIKESGGTEVQEIAVALAMTVEYLSWTEKNKIESSVVWKHLQYHLSTGNNYLLEVGKFRAFRILFDKLTEAYGEKNISPVINAIGFNRNKTVYEPVNNIVRSTIEAMSAMHGGVNSISLNPHDETYKLPDNKTYETTREIIEILTNEGKLNSPHDAVEGSYYLENVTKKITEGAWSFFVDIEKNGGYIETLKNKFIQQQIQILAEKQNDDFMKGELVAVGVNKNPDKEETKTGEYTKVEHVDLTNENRISIPIKPQRITEKLEFERMKKESNQNLSKN